MFDFRIWNYFLLVYGLYDNFLIIGCYSFIIFVLWIIIFCLRRKLIFIYRGNKVKGKSIKSIILLVVLLWGKLYVEFFFGFR